jgi:hypothetical protein
MTCTFGDCIKPTIGRGLCRAHYGRFRRGTLYKPEIPVTLNASGERICNYEGCEEIYKCAGKCATHYFADYRNSQPKFTPDTVLQDLQAQEAEMNRAELDKYWEWVKKELKIA